MNRRGQRQVLGFSPYANNQYLMIPQFIFDDVYQTRLSFVIVLRFIGIGVDEVVYLLVANFFLGNRSARLLNEYVLVFSSRDRLA
jgi:hypothetical protein